MGKSTNTTMKLTLLCLCAVICTAYAFPRPQQRERPQEIAFAQGPGQYAQESGQYAQARADPGYGKQPDGYFQYVNVPAHKEYEFGWNRGHPNHYISRYEQSKDHRFRTRVRWGDDYGGYGEHYYEYNHGPSYEEPHKEVVYDAPVKPVYSPQSNYV